ncbi:MAG TPA: hypothetical protein VGF10_08300 [Gaiella sp.]
MTLRPGPAQGEALVTWGLWAAILVAIVVTYARLEPADLYHVSREGLAGGLSRALVEVNFPIALAAIALALVALAALPGRAWWCAGPAIALCLVTAWPGVVDQDDLDARWINAVPALGVALAFGLTVAAARRVGLGIGRRRRFDAVRLVLAALTLFVSIPWIAALLGFYLPEGLFIMERLGVEDGVSIAAVHLGEHHGFMGAVLVWTALLLSRPAAGVTGRLGTVTRLYLALTFAYGAVNMTQDAWNEQLWKRDVVDWHIPSALLPRLEPIWLVTLGLAAAAALALRRESRGVSVLGG